MSELSKIHILVIDDDEDIVELVCEELEEEGFQVSCAHGGIEAYDMICDNTYHFIICDTTMPNGNGDELLEKLLSENKLAEAKFFFATGLVEYTEESVKELGAHGLFAKPFEIDDIVKGIKKEFNIS